MQDRTFKKIDNGAVVVGALAFAALLIFDLSRESAHPAWIIFDAAMLTLCLAEMVTWLPQLDELHGVITMALTKELVGLTLAASFFYFLFQAANTLQFLLGLAVMLGGLFLLVVGARRMRDVHRAVKLVNERHRGDLR